MEKRVKAVKFEIQALPVMVLREGKSFVAHTPALDLSTCGNTLKQAQDRFIEAVQILFEECAEMGTLDEMLRDLGWERVENKWNPPIVISHALQNVRVPARV